MPTYSESVHFELVLDDSDYVGLLEGGSPAPQHRAALLRQAQKQILN